MLTDVTMQDLDLAESYHGGRYRFDGPIVLDRGGAFGYTVREIPRNDLLTSVAEPGSWLSPDTPLSRRPLMPRQRSARAPRPARPR